MLAAWKSSGWSIMDRAILSAAQMFPDITWWDSWWLLLFLCRLRAVRKLPAASLEGDRQTDRQTDRRTDRQDAWLV